MKRIFALALVPLMMANSSTGALDVVVTDIESTRGALIACLWKDKSGFPTCQKSRSAIILNTPITGATMRVSFKGVAPGTYAVSVQHDADNDGKLKTNFIGMPKEGVGISNNPGGMPSFTKSLVRVNGSGVITVRMRYL
jgi:uncharacterized protein (DUF2141 family)